MRDVRVSESLRLMVPSVDAVGLEARAKDLSGRSIKRESKRSALHMAIRCIDLTTLEGTDTEGKVRALCTKGVQPVPGDDSIPSVAAICVFPEMVPHAADALAGSGVHLASVAGAFPAGLGPLESRLREIELAVEAGADEIDIVLNRSAFMSGDYGRAFDEIAKAKVACGDAHLKTILETGELGSYDAVRTASMLAMAAGSDFIKTSTGKIGVNATIGFNLCMSEAIRDHRESTGQTVGLKLAGGIRTAKQAWQHMVIVAETLGPEFVQPDTFRIGASSLLNDVLMQLSKLDTGRYARPEAFTND